MYWVISIIAYFQGSCTYYAYQYYL